MWKQSNFICDLSKHILNQCMASIPSFPVFNLILNSINYGPHCRMREQGAGDFVKDAFLVIDRYALYKCAVSLGFSVLFTSCSWHVVSKHPDGDGKRPQLKPLKLTNGWCHRSHIRNYLGIPPLFLLPDSFFFSALCPNHLSHVSLTLSPNCRSWAVPLMNVLMIRSHQIFTYEFSISLLNIKY